MALNLCIISSALLSHLISSLWSLFLANWQLDSYKHSLREYYLRNFFKKNMGSHVPQVGFKFSMYPRSYNSLPECRGYMVVPPWSSVCGTRDQNQVLYLPGKHCTKWALPKHLRDGGKVTFKASTQLAPSGSWAPHLTLRFTGAQDDLCQCKQNYMQRV